MSMGWNGKSQPTALFSVPLNLLGGGSWRWPGTPKLDPVVRENIISAEIVGRRKWSEIVSADGVRSEVTRLSREALP